MNATLRTAGIVAAIVVAVLATCTFTVRENEKAIKLVLGEIARSDYKPGLHFKIPFVNTVHTFDARLLTLDVQPERVLTSEKKNVIVDSFMKWRIGDVEAYYTKTGGDERRANTLLSQVVRKATLDAFGLRTVQEVLAGERGTVMLAVRDAANQRANELGIEVTDVRVKKVEFPDDVSDSVFNRMIKERDTVAKQFRSSGQEQAKGIRADADRQREEILARAYSESEVIRGEGDAQAAAIYANAFGEDAEFYSFTRSLEAYKQSFSGQGNVMVLEPDSNFFRYFDALSENR
ncbi:MAG: protease modulator HflC [Pseudomonadota bacterium]